MMEKLSKHFDWEEFGISDNSSGLINYNILTLVHCVMEIIREAYDKPILILSGYRTPEHNKKVGGVSNSQHILGEACDFTGRDFKRLVRIIEELENNYELDYDQLIIYRKRMFIHVSYRSCEDNRNQKIIKL